MADGLCFGCSRLVGRRKAGNSNMQEFICSTLCVICRSPLPACACGGGDDKALFIAARRFAIIANGDDIQSTILIEVADFFLI